MFMNFEVRIWKEMVVDYTKVLTDVRLERQRKTTEILINSADIRTRFLWKTNTALPLHQQDWH
jgi:hypothetical protein